MRKIKKDKDGFLIYIDCPIMSTPTFCTSNCVWYSEEVIGCNNVGQKYCPVYDDGYTIAKCKNHVIGRLI